jgi:hypothetical protein
MNSNAQFSNSSTFNRLIDNKLSRSKFIFKSIVKTPNKLSNYLLYDPNNSQQFNHLNQEYINNSNYLGKLCSYRPYTTPA